MAVDGYYKKSKNLIDEGQFGAPVIQTPFNYAQGLQYGVEFSGNYTSGPFSSYANLALARARGKDITTSQFNFTPADLAYIANHFIFLDHDQTVTASAGAAYRWQGSIFSADLIYGSGLRSDRPLADGDDIPQRQEAGGLHPGERLRLPYLRTGQARRSGGAVRRGQPVRQGPTRSATARASASARPQFGPRRGFFAGITKSFYSPATPHLPQTSSKRPFHHLSRRSLQTSIQVPAASASPA